VGFAPRGNAKQMPKTVCHAGSLGENSKPVKSRVSDQN